MSIVRVLTALVVSCLLAGCGAHGSAGDGGGGDGGRGGAAASDSAGVCRDGLFTAVTCLDSEVGVACPGTTQCPCDGSPVTVKASCTCEAMKDGPSWVCDDAKACANTCVEGSGGGTGGAASDPLDVACARFLNEGTVCDATPPLSTATVASECAKLKTACGSTYSDFFTCFETTKLVCEPSSGTTTVPGCESQVTALYSCGAGT